MMCWDQKKELEQYFDDLFNTSEEEESSEEEEGSNEGTGIPQALESIDSENLRSLISQSSTSVPIVDATKHIPFMVKEKENSNRIRT